MNLPVAIRYPRADVPEDEIKRNSDSIEVGKGEILREGTGRCNYCIRRNGLFLPAMC